MSRAFTAMLRTAMFKLSQEDQLRLSEGYLGGTLDDYAIIKASGATVRDYLQGQLTQDIRRLTASQGIYSAILTPQGKTVSDMHMISGHNHELIIIACRAYAEALVGRLRQFALGHELRIGIVDSLKLISIQGKRCDDFLELHNLPVPDSSHLNSAAATGRELFVIRMAEAADNGIWIVTDDADAIGDLSGVAAIHAARICKGLPTYGIDWNEKTFPLNANLIEFEGVSFDKGCYVGQEVTSRMQWRGGIRKHLYRVELESYPSELPSPISTTVEIGSITSAAIDAEGVVHGISYLPIETVESGSPLIDANGDSIQVIEVCHV